MSALSFLSTVELLLILGLALVVIGGIIVLYPGTKVQTSDEAVEPPPPCFRCKGVTVRVTSDDVGDAWLCAPCGIAVPVE